MFLLYEVHAIWVSVYGQQILLIYDHFICRNAIRLGNGEMPRSVREGLSSLILTPPLELQEPILLGSSLHVTEEEQN